MRRGVFDDVMERFSLGGYVNLPDEFLRTTRSLWTSIVDSSSEDAFPKFCLMYFDFRVGTTTGDHTISHKLYIPLSETSHPDSFIAEQLLKHIDLKGQDSYIRSFLTRQQSKNLAYLGVSPSSNGGVEVTAYSNPCIYANDGGKGGVHAGPWYQNVRL